MPIGRANNGKVIRVKTPRLNKAPKAKDSLLDEDFV